MGERRQARARVTQRVPLAEVADLVTEPARAAVAFAGPDGPEVLPVLLGDGDGLRFGVPAPSLPEGGLPEQVVLVADDGASWFELRAAVWRGRASPEGSGSDGRSWYRLEPRTAVAWDYGRLRQEPPP